MAHLIINGRIVPLRELEHSIGRHRANSVRISSESVSRFHAALIQADNGYLIVDRGSQNGTFVDGKRVKSQLLVGNEEIRIGDTVLSFRIGVPDRSIGDRHNIEAKKEGGSNV